jgi:outer membrane protein
LQLNDEEEFLMRTLIVSLTALAAAIPQAQAETLTEAMVSAVETNPSLGAERQRLNATREELPQAWSEALPQISLGGVATARDTDSDNPLLDTGTSETWVSTANVSQLLFGSGRVLSSTRAARAQIAGAVAGYEGARQQLLLDVTAAYADVMQAQAIVAARETNVSNLSRLYEFAQAQFDAGVVTRTDVAQSQARLAQARTLLVQAQGALAASVQAYQRLVGRPPSGLEAPPNAGSLPSDLGAALEIAARSNPQLIGAVAAVELADANVDVAASQGRLSVTLEGSSALGGDYDDDTLESRTDSVGVRVAIPLLNGGFVRSLTRQQRALRAASNLDLAATQRSVEEQVTTAWTGLMSARAAVDSAREQVDAAELAYEGVLLEQETGLRSTVEVLDQEADLLTARIALAQARRNLVVAERQMLFAVGALGIPDQPSGTEVQDELRGR